MYAGVRAGVSNQSKSLGQTSNARHAALSKSHYRVYSGRDIFLGDNKLA